MYINSLPLPYPLPWKTTENGNPSSLHIEISKYIFSEWWCYSLKLYIYPFGQTSNFLLFHFNLCIYQRISKWMYKHSLSKKCELKRLPSGTVLSDFLLQHTKSSCYFSFSFSHARTSSLALCHGLKSQEIQTTISQAKKVQELKTFCRWHLQFSKTSLFKMN